MALQEINDREQEHQSPAGHSYRFSYAVGRGAGRKNMGSETHLIRITHRSDSDRPSYHATCHSNGQQTGWPIDNLDTDRVTCSKCLKTLEKLQVN